MFDLLVKPTLVSLIFDYQVLSRAKHSLAACHGCMKTIFKQTNRNADVITASEFANCHDSSISLHIAKTFVDL